MSKLEKFMKEKRLLLDSDAPADGHEDRFLQKLQGVPGRHVNFRHVLQVAASVAIILASAIVLVRQNRSGDKVAGSEIPQAVQEADFYFTSEVNARYDRIREFNFENSEEKAVLLDELKELDTFHQQLMNDLKTNPDDERIVNALIRHYQIKLEVMDQIIEQLNQIKSVTSENHENESV
ncbi:MAG: hypothetical protein EHM46_01995 [Bacteroidetes bacterium]|nr:MAG: hypothetical protein EHM46_01995 [Bacteroidota bacterium]